MSSDKQYQEIQAIYLKWHDGHRPLSGFVNEITALSKVEVAKAKKARDLTWKRRLSDAYTWADEQCELESLTATGVWKVQEYIEQTELAEVEANG